MYNKIPVLLHIPKNAGSYIIQVLTKYFIRCKKNSSDLRVRRLTVQTQNSNLTIFCHFLTNYWETDPNMKQIAQRASSCKIGTFFTYLKNQQLEVLSIAVEPIEFSDMREGCFLAYKIIDLCKSEPFNFTIFRDCFARQQSLYYYLTSAASSHEPSHNSIKEESFLDYIKSSSLEDSWLIRVLTSARPDTSLNKYWLQVACNFLDSNNFLITDIGETDSALKHVIDECFDIPIAQIDLDNPFLNSTKIANKITLEDLDEQTKQKFLDHTYWDRRLWERYCK